MFRVKVARTHCGKMGPLEELKLFVSDLLHGVTSEIVGAIEKTITEYEEQASRLKEENDRHRSLLDIILRAKLPQPVGWSIRTTCTLYVVLHRVSFCLQQIANILLKDKLKGATRF